MHSENIQLMFLICSKKETINYLLKLTLLNMLILKDKRKIKCLSNMLKQEKHAINILGIGHHI